MLPWLSLQEFLREEAPTRKSVQHVLKFVSGEFGLSKEELPTKLLKLVTDALAESSGGNTGKKGKEKPKHQDVSMPAEPKKRAKKKAKK